MALRVRKKIEARRRQERQRQTLTRAAAHIEGDSIPKTPEAFSEFCLWPHIETGKLVGGLSPTFSRWAAQRSSFRCDEDGQRIGGRDWIRKARKQIVTCGIMDFIAFSLCTFEHFLAMTVIHKKDEAISRPLMNLVGGMFGRLPEAWTGAVRKSGLSYSFGRTGSSWHLATAGSSPDVAEGLVSGTIHALHFTETAKFRFPKLTWKAIQNALPPNGWFVSETTAPPSPSHWAAQQWAMAEAGNVAGTAFFSPWHEHPLHRIPAGSPEFRRLMGKAFSEKMPAEDLKKEDELKLNAEQKAFRRSKRNQGTEEDRENAKQEFPEYPEEPFDRLTGRYLDVGCLRQLESQQIPPVAEDRIVQIDVRIFRRDFSGHVTIACDYARLGGRDRMGFEAIATATGEQLAECHGRGLASEGVDALVRMLELLQIDPADWDRYVVAPERNKDGGDLVAECLAADLHVWAEQIAVGDQRRKKVRYGFFTGEKNRPAMIRRIVHAVEGSGRDEEGLPRQKAPTMKIWSSWLIAELKSLVRQPESFRVEAEEGYHDDLAIAYGAALWLADQIKIGLEPAPRPRKRARQKTPRGHRRGGGPR